MDADSVLKIVRDYDIPLDAVAVRAAFAEQEQPSELTKWAALHLTPDTLLTRNEHEQYTALRASGQLERLASSVDLSAVRPLSEDELRDAIAELNRSTTAITKQTEVLEATAGSVVALDAESTNRVDARTSLNSKRKQKWEADRRGPQPPYGNPPQETLGYNQQLTDICPQLEIATQNLELKVSEINQAANGAGDVMNPLVIEVLRSDDKLLASLQKLGHELAVHDPEEEANVANLRELCARLIKCDVETIRARLDRLYLQALRTPEQKLRSEHAVLPDEVPALEEEVDSLYAEILPVAQMSVQQQFLDPALRSVAKRNRQDGVKSDVAFEYMQACLEYLLERTNRLCTRVETFYAHRQATEELIQTAKAELAVQVTPSQPKHERRPTNPESPTRRRKSSGHSGTTSPIRLRATLGRRRSSGGAMPDEPPLEQLLRTLAISLPQGDVSSAPSGNLAQTNPQVSALDTIVTERAEKLSDVAYNVQESFETSATAQLADVGRALMAIWDSVLAESPFGRVQLADPAIESSIEFLAREAAAVQARLEGLEAHLSRAKAGNAKRDEVIRRWHK